MEMRMIRALALGQVLSLCITGAAFASSLLSRQGIYVPTSISFLNYLVLASVNGIRLLRRRQKLQKPWYFYVVLAVIDMEANFLAAKSIRYTSITSVVLLDSWNIPCVLALTWFLLNARYLRGHCFGVCLCVLGLVLVLLSDVHAGDRSGASNALLGDVFILTAATLYACANAYEEFLLRQVELVELLTFFGLFGAITSGCQALFLEGHVLVSTDWSMSSILPFISYAACLYTFSSLLPHVLQMSGATMMNLSLLTSDMYAIAIRSVLFHQTVDWLYFVAFAVVAVGLICYALSGEPSGVGIETDDIQSKDFPYERLDMS